MITDDRRFKAATEILDTGKNDPNEMKLVRKHLRKIGWKYSDDPRLHNAYARLYRRIARPEAAYKALAKAEGLCRIQEYPSPRLNLGLFYEDFKFWRKALEAYEEVICYHPEHSSAIERQKEVHERRASLCAEFGLQYPPTAPGDALVLNTLELLVAADVKVRKVKGRVKDNLGLDHEVDILCETDVLPGEPVPFVVECKDWSRSISRPTVDQFRSLLTTSPYRLGMIVASQGITTGAITAAKGSGILIKTISDLENSMEKVLHTRLKRRKITWVRDFASTRGPTEEQKNARALATQEFIESIMDGHVTPTAEVTLSKKAISVKEQPLVWFDAGEFRCYEKALGQLKRVPILLLLFHMSWWNNIDDLAHSAFAVRPW